MFPYWEYGTGSTSLLNTEPIQKRIHHTTVKCNLYLILCPGVEIRKEFLVHSSHSLQDNYNRKFISFDLGLQIRMHPCGQCFGACAALFGRSREKRGGSGSSSTAQAPAMAPCLKKRYNKNGNNVNSINLSLLVKYWKSKALVHFCE